MAAHHHHVKHVVTIKHVSDAAEDQTQVAKAKSWAKDAVEDIKGTNKTAAMWKDFKEDKAGKAKNGSQDAKEDSASSAKWTQMMKDGKEDMTSKAKKGSNDAK